MTRRFGLALVLGLGLVLGGRSAGPDASLEQLIEQLGSRDFKTRESATKALAERGGDALPALRKASAHPDPEVRQRLGQLIATTERTLLLAPKRVTFNLDRVPVRDALAELTRQTGYRIELQGGPAQAVTLHVENATFWEAFDQLCARGGLTLQPQNDMNGGLMVYAQGGPAGPAVDPFLNYRGPFRLAAVSFHYNKSLSFAAARNTLAGGQRSEQLTFMFSVAAEPKLPLLGVGQPRLIAAEDEMGHSMMPVSLGHVVESFYGFGYYGYRNVLMQTQVQLTGYGTSAHSLRLIKGALPVTLLAEQKPEIVVEDVLQVKKKKFEGPESSLEIDSVHEGPNNTYQVALTARRSSKDGSVDYNWINSLHQRLELTDEKGQKFLAHGFNQSHSTPTSIQGTFLFGAPGNVAIGKPTQLTYYGWVTLQHQVEFEFRDLPLP